MPDRLTEADEPTTSEPDSVTRRAALWAAVVAVPVTLLVGAVLVLTFADVPAGSGPSASAAAPPPTSPVDMPAPRLTDRAAAACRAVVGRLPQAVRGLPRRTVSAGPEQNAAYGEPAITVACGVSAPSVAPEDFLLTMDRVCWHPKETGDATVFTTADRLVPVRVTVPRAYEQRGQWANEFSATVATTIPPSASAPSGCAG
jgi:Protein of unknown function (DUF3515)